MIRKNLGVVLMSGGFALLMSWPLLGHLPTGGLGGDWNQNLEMAWATWGSLVHGHFPLLQDYPCANFPLFGHPESRLGPWILLHLLFGPIVGLHLEIVGHIAIGFAGTYWLGRNLGMSTLGAIVAATGFMGSDWYYLHAGVGHVMFMAFVYVPWIWGALYRGKYWVGGCLLALMIYEGGVVYPVPYLILSLVILAPAWKRLETGLLILATGILIAMPKLVLMFENIKPRWAGLDGSSVGDLARVLFERAEFSTVLPWFEMAAYVAPAIAFLALLGIMNELKRAWPIVLVGILFFVLALGDHAPLWIMIHSLPVFEDLRVTSRFLIPVTLCFGLLAGFGVSQISTRWACAFLVAILLDYGTLSPQYLGWALGGDQTAGGKMAEGELSLSTFNYREPNIHCDGVWR